MAGTYGTIASIPLCTFALWQGRVHGAAVYVLIAAGVFFIGLWCVPKAERLLGPRTNWHGKTKTHDQNQIVIDETFGMFVTCVPLLWCPQVSFNAVLIAFLLFRLLDMIKVPPSRFFDNMPNSVGVMMDDGVAGVYAAALLWVCVTLC